MALERGESLQLCVSALHGSLHQRLDRVCHCPFRLRSWRFANDLHAFSLPSSPKKESRARTEDVGCDAKDAGAAGRSGGGVLRSGCRIGQVHGRAWRRRLRGGEASSQGLQHARVWCLGLKGAKGTRGGVCMRDAQNHRFYPFLHPMISPSLLPPPLLSSSSPLLSLSLSPSVFQQGTSDSNHSTSLPTFVGQVPTSEHLHRACLSSPPSLFLTLTCKLVCVTSV